MAIRKIAYPFILLLIVGISASCDTPTTNKNEKPKDKIIIFQNSHGRTTNQQITSLLNKGVFQKSQIIYRYKNKISGFSANLFPVQIKQLKSKKHKWWGIIPGQFIIVFKDPFDGEISDKANAWAMQAIKKMQKKYNVSDDQILSKYGYALRGFAAKLSDKQLYELDHEKLVKNIEPNMWVKENWGKVQ